MRGLRKRSLLLEGHSTSLALEPEFWNALEALARAQGVALPVLLTRIDAGREGRSLASASRVTALAFASRR